MIKAITEAIKDAIHGSRKNIFHCKLCKIKNYCQIIINDLRHIQHMKGTFTQNAEAYKWVTLTKPLGDRQKRTFSSTFSLPLLEITLTFFNTTQESLVFRHVWTKSSKKISLLCNISQMHCLGRCVELILIPSSLSNRSLLVKWVNCSVDFQDNDGHFRKSKNRQANASENITILIPIQDIRGFS